MIAILLAALGIFFAIALFERRANPTPKEVATWAKDIFEASWRSVALWFLCGPGFICTQLIIGN